MDIKQYKNYFSIVIACFVFAQGIFVFYKIIPVLLNLYTSSPSFLIPFTFAAVGGFAAIGSGLSIILKKRWAIMPYWVLCIVPIVAMAINPLFRMPGIGKYWIIALNILFAGYLTIVRGSEKNI